MSTLKVDTVKPITSSGDLSLQGDSSGSAVDCLNIDSSGDINFSGNTDAKIKLPSAGGIYESNGTTAILTESGGTATLANVVVPVPTVRVYGAGSSTWTKPSLCSYVRVRLVGSGSGGASGNGSDTPGGGGAGGGYSEKIIAAGSLGSTETGTVGAGGAGNTGTTTVGAAGATSSFGSHCSATGGAAQSGWPTGAVGGTGSGGDLNSRGGGGDSADLSIQKNMQGGASVLGPGPGRSGQGISTADVGGYGAGGNGCLDDGGNGVDGVCIVYEY